MNRRRATLTLMACAAMTISGLAQAQEKTEIEVHYNPNWGCCGAWMEHLRANGFRVKPIPTQDAGAVRRDHGIPDTLAGCHTGVAGGYAIEGHVPASDIKRLLAEKPRARGLTVPGMPAGSPGMEGARSDPFDVLLVHNNGRHSIYRSHPR